MDFAALEQVLGFDIADNPSYPTCEAEALAQRITVGGQVTIHDNAPEPTSWCE